MCIVVSSMNMHKLDKKEKTLLEQYIKTYKMEVCFCATGIMLI